MGQCIENPSSPVRPNSTGYYGELRTNCRLETVINDRSHASTSYTQMSCKLPIHTTLTACQSYAPGRPNLPDFPLMTRRIRHWQYRSSASEVKAVDESVKQILSLLCCYSVAANYKKRGYR